MQRSFSRVTGILLSIILLLNLVPDKASAVDCFPGATFPKMIGYGLADTSVVSIDRRAADDFLALAITTTENDLVGAYTNVISVTNYDPGTDTYIWYQVVDDAKYAQREAFVYFTPDGNRVLFFYFRQSTDGPGLLYLNAGTGALEGNAIQILNYYGYVGSRDYLTMNSTGSKVYWIH